MALRKAEIAKDSTLEEVFVSLMEGAEDNYPS